MNSSFIFSTDTLQASENLLLYELTNLNARSNLVVLSACETGIGAFHQGDGVRSLGNGFLHSGIPSVVMSLWKVPDESTSIIMKNFYTFLKEGHSKAAALQKAKQEYLAKAISVEQKHPYYWAGFILSGNEAPIKLDTGTAYNKIALFALGLVLLIGLILYYRKKQNT
jgi:LPXTG-motif cell wall-anchored protein